MDKLASQSIRNLRFPLCIAIVMVHSNISIYNESAAQNPIVNFFFYIWDIYCYIYHSTYDTLPLPRIS